MRVTITTNGSPTVNAVVGNVLRDIRDFEGEERKAADALAEVRARLALLRDLRDAIERHGVEPAEVLEDTTARVFSLPARSA